MSMIRYSITLGTYDRTVLKYINHDDKVVALSPREAEFGTLKWLSSYFLFLQEQLKGIIIIRSSESVRYGTGRTGQVLGFCRDRIFFCFM